MPLHRLWPSWNAIRRSRSNIGRFPTTSQAHRARNPTAEGSSRCRSIANSSATTRSCCRAALDEERNGADAPSQLTGGQALIARLLLALRETGCDLRLNTPMTRLVVRNGDVVGVEVTVDGAVRSIEARHGVLLAAGGFERNDEMRRRYGVPSRATWSMGAPGAQGSAIDAGLEAGGTVALMDEAWWAPGVMHPDGSSTFTLGIRGGIFVNASGHRFANESLPYDQMGRIVLELDHDGSHVPFWFVFDDRFDDGMPANSTLPMGPVDEYIAAGVWHTADDLTTLAQLLDVPADALLATVDRFNGFAASRRRRGLQPGRHAVRPVLRHRWRAEPGARADRSWPVPRRPVRRVGSGHEGRARHRRSRACVARRRFGDRRVVRRRQHDGRDGRLDLSGPRRPDRHQHGVLVPCRARHRRASRRSAHGARGTSIVPLTGHRPDQRLTARSTVNPTRKGGRRWAPRTTRTL